MFPDGELEGPGYLVSLMNDSGFEVRHEENLREHYAMTLAGWCANLDAHWDEAVAEVGEGTARVWRLYMAGSRLGFERNVVQLHQVLGVRLGADGQSGMPLRPDWEAAVARVEVAVAPWPGPGGKTRFRRAHGANPINAGGRNRVTTNVGKTGTATR